MAEDGTLEPRLTAWDRRILAAVPSWPLGSHDERPELPNQWEIAMAIRTEDVAGVRQTLRGLYDRHLVCVTAKFELHRRRYWRTAAGDAYLEANGG